jgi:hypothetical protein
MATEKFKWESPWMKERRLKKRKKTLTMKYKKGVTFDNPYKLVEWLGQKDILVYLNSSGQLDDDTEFVQITIEGVKA